MKLSAQYLEVLSSVRGYYKCPKDKSGKRLGPLVGYAGRDENDKQYVGDVYVNFAKAEENTHVLDGFADFIVRLEPFKAIELIDVFLGAPEGGKALALLLALKTGCRCVSPEKKTIELETPTSREKTKFVFGRHSLSPSGRVERVVLVEDVLNNFSSTEKLIRLVHDNGGAVIAIVSFLNRSLREIRDTYISPVLEHGIPIISLVDIPIPEYRQDDPEVSDDISRGNVIWKPKDRWSELEAAMRLRDG